MLCRSPRNLGRHFVKRAKQIAVTDFRGEQGRIPKCFRGGRCRKDHLPRANLEDEWPRGRGHFGEFAETGGEEGDAVFNVAHGQAPAEFAPRAQFSGLQFLCDARRGSQEFNACS